MRSETFAWSGLLLVGLAAGFAFRGTASKARLAARRATGTTFRSGVSNGERATADPARGMPA